MAFLVVAVGARNGRAAAPIPLTEARQAFDEARELALRDAGKLWGCSLDGPIMFVDPGTRALVANQHGPAGTLHEEEGVFTGTFPTELNLANTSFDWLGTRWTQVMWFPPVGPVERQVLWMHELFHRVQPGLRLWPTQQPANAHLDTLEGRYLLRLEWLALGRALQAINDKAVCREAVAEALLFRAQRQAIFPNAQAEENAMEETEGLAEYTGVKLGCPDQPDEQVTYALADLTRTAQLDTFVRSFAYATGPAYGLLLDRCDEEGNGLSWRVDYKSGPDFANLLATRTGVTLPSDLAAAVEARNLDPQSRKVRTEEEARETHRQQLSALDRRRLVDGPTVRIPLRHMNVQFDPRNLRPLDALGTVYPTMRISDDWGTLEVSDGALLSPAWDRVTVAGPPEKPSEGTIRGPGWIRKLKGDKTLASGEREGDYLLKNP